MDEFSGRRIEDVTRATVRASCSVMARAFADDPVLRWINPGRRGDALAFAGVYAASHGSPGSAHAVFDGDEMVGAAWWDPPGYEPSKARQVASLPLLVAGTRTGLLRGAALVSVCMEHRPKAPHWYLGTIGAVHTGRGIGTALLEHGLSRVTGTAYLESSNPLNVPLYQRFGFEPLAPIRPKGGPELIPMLRPA